MKFVLLDALKDSAEMIPFLLVIYFFVEWIEHKFGHKIQEDIEKSAKAGPVVGALFGCVPQCGFSVLASAMYTRTLITDGTLIAVYLSTSDEAIPVIMSQPNKIWIVAPLLITKLLIGIVCGYFVDIVFRSYKKAMFQTNHNHNTEIDEIHEKGCCEHRLSGEDGNREMFIHPLVHTAKIFIFVFVVTAFINCLIWQVGEENLSKVLLSNTIFQPIITAIIGLIPNCAASVAITEVFLKGGISFGSAISGLCASGGLGMLVLMKENGSIKDTLRILGMLVGISIFVGIIIQYVYG